MEISVPIITFYFTRFNIALFILFILPEKFYFFNKVIEGRKNKAAPAQEEATLAFPCEGMGERAASGSDELSKTAHRTKAGSK